MANVIKHPNAAAGASTQLRRLRQSMEIDRKRAITTLKVALTKLQALRVHIDLPILQALSSEYAAFVDMLQRLDAANVDDNLTAQLDFIQSRLQNGLDILSKLTTAEETQPDTPQG